MYDLIGDVHGHADELVRLLERLGYEEVQRAYRHPDRKVIFLGDFIDRGPQIPQVLRTVRPMVEAGHAMAVMGNHELNALAYHTEDQDAPGQFLRRHTAKNTKQHRATLDQLSPQELQSHLDWFRTLPLWLDLDGLRVVHACWDDRAVAEIGDALNGHDGMTDEVLHSACREGGPLFEPIETILKGREVALPDGASFADKDGHVRTEFRTRWYLPPEGQTYRTYAMTNGIDCDRDLEDAVVAAAAAYPSAAKPVFIGHYWLSADRPRRLADNVACVDYSVAKGGFLCAYRWNGEQTLNDAHFARV